MGTSTKSSTEIKRAFAASPLGQIHYAEAGTGDPVLFLHETPRSWDQYRDVLPIVGETRRAIAMDTLGFGDSCSPRDDESVIEAYAEGVVYLLDALELDRVTLVGHHTGGVVAIEVAATVPERVERLIVSSTPLVNDAYRVATEDFTVDESEQSEAGTHLGELWEQRFPHYPDEGRAELLDRLVADALKCGKHASAGHAAVADYEMEPKLDRIEAPIHVIIGGADEHAREYAPWLVERAGPASTEVIDDGPVPMPEHLPQEFSAAVLRALDG